MLTTLRIQNMALIPAVEINFGPAFNVLTGETGAGKSIIIGSLNFIFGDKLSTNVIRAGADFARVTAVFDDTIITRTLRTDGKSEIRVNDEPVTLKGLRAVASELLAIHGQHDTEKLLTPKNHLAILDGFGHTALATYQAEYNQLQTLKKELSSYGDNPAERERLLDLYQYQINEIANAHLNPDEEYELNNKAIVLRNAEKLTTGLDEIITQLDTADTATGRANKKLLGLVPCDAQLSPLADRLSGTAGELTDILLELRDYVDRADFSAGSLEAVYDRLDVIKNLKRKYGATVADILTYLEQTQVAYQRLLNAGDTIAELNARIAEQTARVKQAAAQVTAARQAAAAQLTTQLGQHLADLGMPHAQFEVRFTAVTPNSHGADDVEFYFSANLGEALRPLAQIISGGEMSRVMLAIKTVANTEPGKTLIFDEIDTGLSGNMGLAVADKLTALAKHTQIIVVTHLAAIAAAADKHYLIQKNISNQKTVTNVYPLNPEERVQEVARIIGGGTTALAHAAALLHSQRWFIYVYGGGAFSVGGKFCGRELTTATLTRKPAQSRHKW